MAKTVKFTGDEKLERLFEKLPEAVSKKAVTAAYRKGASIFTKRLKSNMPGSGMKRTVGTKSKKKWDHVRLIAGVKYDTSKAPYTSGAGSEIPSYLVAYWHNYGTLSKRDFSHDFSQPRKRQTANWDGGIKAKHFVEESWEATQSQVENRSESEMRAQIMKQIKKYQVK
jgi:hypothetical protein